MKIEPTPDGIPIKLDTHFMVGMKFFIKSLKKPICCPESEYHDDYCCMRQRGFNEAIEDILEKLND